MAYHAELEVIDEFVMRKPYPNEYKVLFFFYACVYLCIVLVSSIRQKGWGRYSFFMQKLFFS